jgi:hypothetical protein
MLKGGAEGRALKMPTVAVASVPIRQNGGYEFPQVPIGLMKVCIATDPDVPRHALKKAARPELEPPLKDKAPRPGDKLPPDFGTKGKPGFGPGKGTPDFDPIAKMKNFNPETEKMDAGEKAVLRQIHKMYGDPGSSPLILPIHPGEQRRDFELDPVLTGEFKAK